MDNLEDRPEKDIYYLGIARQVARRSTCLNLKFGAIIVKEDALIASGYIGAPRKVPNCTALKRCFKKEFTEKSRNESCRSLHAEANALLNAARTGANVLNGIMYIFGEDARGNVLSFKPCIVCRRMIINAGIKEVVVPWRGQAKRYKVENWVKEVKKNPFKEFFG
ncbi:MAG: deaminase [Candidatus Pacearchaeota archaeon]